jgi:transcriptional regulator with XRE-family HTH domain
MATDICVALGLRIRKLRKERRWRQIDLAEHAGINVIYISDLEHGKKEACLRMIQTLAESFNLTVSELMRGIE